VSRAVAAFYRALLWTYPPAFRREYGDEMLRRVGDELRFGSVGPWRTGTRLVWDVARTAPRMRWESNMSRVVLVSVAVAVAVIAGFVGSPILLLALLAIAFLAYLALVRDNPGRTITAPPERARGWYWWLLASGGFVLAGFGVLTIEGGDELSEIGWSLWMLTWGAAIVMLVIGIVLAVTHFAHRRSGAPPPAAAG
jgi:hypothetical protein